MIYEIEDFNQETIQYLKSFPEIQLQLNNRIGIIEALEAYDVLWFRLEPVLGMDHLRLGQRCKTIICPVTGLDHIDEELCDTLGIRIISLKGEVEFLKEVRATAELTIGLMISLMRKINPAYQDVLDGNWNRNHFRGHELYQKKVGIIGLGRLGSIVADYCITLGMEVFAYDVKSISQSNIKMVNSIEELVELVDIVSIHVDYSKRTHHLINKSVFQKMKMGSWLINTSRGAVVDEQQLLKALKSGSILGAALDVVQNEREFDEQNPLCQYAMEHDNLLLTPHLGGNTFESFRKTEQFVAEKLIRHLNLIKI